MNTLLYFLPDTGAFGAAQAERVYRERGLSDVLAGLSPETRTCAAGPGGQSGVVFAATGTADTVRVLYDADSQTWTKCNGGKFWIGWWNDKRPGPADLARRDQVGGYRVRMADGEEWLIPVARQIDGSSTLPQIIYWGEDGTPVREVEERYRPFCARAETVWSEVSSEEGLQRDETELFPLCAEALSVNYRVGPWEASALRLFNTTAVTDVIRAIIDLPRWQEWIALKKNEDERTGSTGSNATDGSEAT